jgi:hypothetical protein
MNRLSDERLSDERLSDERLSDDRLSDSSEKIPAQIKPNMDLT